MACHIKNTKAIHLDPTLPRHFFKVTTLNSLCAAIRTILLGILSAIMIASLLSIPAPGIYPEKCTKGMQYGAFMNVFDKRIQIEQFEEIRSSATPMMIDWQTL